MIFNVKKTGAACAVAATLFAASWGAHAASVAAAASDVINFTAKITDQTCTPDWDATKGTDVDFKNVSLKDLSEAGKIGSYRPFTLTLKECKNVAGVDVAASGTADATNTSAFANTATGEGAATNVAFVLMGGSNLDTQLAPDLGEVEYKADKDATSITLPFMAELVATGTATAGTASGTATLYMTYE